LLQKHAAGIQLLAARVGESVEGGGEAQVDFGLRVVAALGSEADPEALLCPSRDQGGVCGTCRAYFDPDVKAVAYRRH
jgi:hypothetical protein